MVEIKFDDELDAAQYIRIKHRIEKFLLERKIPFSIRISTMKGSMYIESLHIQPLVRELKILLKTENIPFSIK